MKGFVPLHPRGGRTAPGTRRRTRRRGIFLRIPGERGSSVLEFALVLPMLGALVMGIIDFGMAFNNWSALRQGVFAGARSGSLSTFPTISGCTSMLTFGGGGSAPSADLENLMCLTKQEIGLNTTSTRIDIVVDDPTMTIPNSSWAVGDALTVCAEVPLSSVTGFFGGVLNGSDLEAKTTIRIEEGSSSPETQGYETDPTGANWSWCTPSSPTP